MKSNFVGGKLKLKNVKEDNQTKKIKKIMTKDIITKTIPNKGKTFIYEGDSEIVQSIEENERERELQQVDKKEQREPIYIDTRTAAEKRFDEIHLRRLPDKIETVIQTTFKEKFDKFGKNLSKIPIHYDIPKVGPG